MRKTYSFYLDESLIKILDDRNFIKSRIVEKSLRKFLSEIGVGGSND